MTNGIWKKTNGRIDLAGIRFGRLHVIGRATEQPCSDDLRWHCKCDCGNEKDIRGTALRRKETISCGCYSREVAYAQHGKNIKHGHAGTPAYRSWASMHGRCSNQNHDNYHRYGGAGIVVCARWTDFMAFLEDMGERPDGTTLDRLDGDGNYEPGNCRWATRKEQQNNRRDNLLAWHEGEILTAQEIADRTGEPYHVVRRRIQRGAKAQQIREATQKVLDGGGSLAV